MAALATREYWDARYELDKLPFDWYCRFNTSDAYKNLVLALIKKEHKILIVGAGTSRLPEELIEADYNHMRPRLQCGRRRTAQGAEASGIKSHRSGRDRHVAAA